MNKNSQLYRLSEVFDVYNQNKQAINVHHEVPESESDFKNSNPRDIYHLNLHHQMNDLSLEDTRDVSGNGTTSHPDAQPNGQVDHHGSNGSFNPSYTNGSNGSDGFVTNGSESIHSIRPSPIDTSLPSMSLLQPSQINWFYLDPSGNQQGPFNGELMQTWFNDGYLNLDLHVKRQNGDFQPLKSVCESLNDFVTPFSVPLPVNPEKLTPKTNGVPQVPVSSTSTSATSTNQVPSGNSSLHAQHSLMGSSLLNNPLMNQPLFNDPLMPQMYPFQMGNINTNINSMNILQPMQNQMPISHQNTNPVLSRTNSNWGGLTTDYSSPTTPIANLSGSLMGQSIQQPALQPTPMSPWSAVQGTRPHSQSRVSSPFVATPSGAVDPEINSSVIKDILGESSNTSPVISQPNVIVAEEILQPNVVTVEEILQPSIVTAEEISQPNVVVAEEEVSEFVEPSVVDAAPITSASVIPAVAAPTAATSAAAVDPVDPIDKLKPRVETLKPSTQAKENKAPWAASTSSTKTTPKLTLKEIQRLESERLEKQRLLDAQVQAELQVKSLKEELAREELAERETKKSLPQLSGWAKASSSQVKVTKTLAEIQEEERKLAEVNKKKTTSSTSLASTIGTTQVPASTPKVEEGWSTITKKVIKKPNTPSSVSYSAAAAGVGNVMPNPDTLRGISSVTPIKTDNSHAVREEFIIWARSQMLNLYPSVSANDLLEMFISLPKNQDSLQLISETIYASSTTMNGRVFAQEFLKKKLHYSKLISNPGDLTAWSLAIASSADKVATVDEDGWSTTKKKKGRK